MKFFYLHVPGMYTLDRLELPSYVDDEDMTCTFNTESKLFVIKVPVVTEGEEGQDSDDTEAQAAAEAAQMAAANAKKAAEAPTEEFDLAALRAKAQGAKLSDEEKKARGLLYDTSKAAAVREESEEEDDEGACDMGGDPFEGL